MMPSWDRRWTPCTYIIEAPGCGLVKIGTTDNPDVRFRAHCTASPIPLVLVALIPGEMISEGNLHRALAHYRHHGEWFRAEPIVREYLDYCVLDAAWWWFEIGSGAIPPLTREGYLEFDRKRRLEFAGRLIEASRDSPAYRKALCTR